MANIVDIEGIGEVYTEKLAGIGITTTQALLKRGSTPKGRQEIAESGDISGKLVLEWVNRADLFRIKGVAEEYSDLLEVGGGRHCSRAGTAQPREPLQRTGGGQCGEEGRAAAAEPGAGRRLGCTGQGPSSRDHVLATCSQPDSARLLAADQGA